LPGTYHHLLPNATDFTVKQPTKSKCVQKVNKKNMRSNPETEAVLAASLDWKCVKQHKNAHKSCRWKQGGVAEVRV